MIVYCNIILYLLCNRFALIVRIHDRQFGGIIGNVAKNGRKLEFLVTVVVFV
jgi:hypothetical protein